MALSGAGGDGASDDGLRPGGITPEEVRRSEYPSPGKRIFVDSASYGLLPRRTVEAVEAMGRARTIPGGFTDRELGEQLWRARRAAAKLVGGRAEEITLAPNTSFGMNLAAELVAKGSPGKIVVSEGEFPANVLPWRTLEARGFEVERVGADPRGLPDEARLLERLTEGDEVRAFSVSAVQFASGYRVDLASFARTCREREILLVVDAIQSLGVTPLGVEPDAVDLIASGAQKWLCSPWGSGFVWIPERHRRRFDPPMVSWLAMEDADDFDRLLDYRYRFREDGRKYELATLGVQDYIGMARSLELLLEVGVSRIRAHVHDLHEPLLRWSEMRDGVEALTPVDPAKRGGILSFRSREVPRLAAALDDAGVRAAVRDGVLRFAPHVYNTAAEMERVVEILDEALTRARA